MSGKVVGIIKQKETRKITWSGAVASNWIDVCGINSALKLELPAAFVGTTLTYKTRSGSDSGTPPAAAGVAIHKDGAALEDTVAGSTASINVLSIDLYGVDWLQIISDQSETCEGYLHGSS